MPGGDSGAADATSAVTGAATGSSYYPEISTERLQVMQTPSGLKAQFSDYRSCDGDYYVFTPSNKNAEFIVHDSPGKDCNCVTFSYTASADIECKVCYTVNNTYTEDSFTLKEGADVVAERYVVGAEKNKRFGNTFRIKFVFTEETLLRIADISFSYVRDVVETRSAE